MSAEAIREAKVFFLSESELCRGLTQLDLDEVERSTTMSTCTRGRVI